MTTPAVSRVRHYADILAPLFWNESFNEVHRVFEWACTMVRVTGMQDTGWDSYSESIAFLEDCSQLQQIDLPQDRFPVQANTRARIALISYSHMIEMSVPYDLLANLLRLRLGMKYSTDPLIHLNKRQGYKDDKGIKRTRIKPAFPIAKIAELERMATQAGLPDVGEALKSIYSNTIRNAVFHSDYAIHDNSMRILSGSYQMIPFDELAQFTNDAFAFHSALLSLWRRQRKLFVDFRGKILPYDDRYKGVIEFTFDGESLNGFRTYWPNGMVGFCAREADGQSVAQNIDFEKDGSINFFIGLYADQPGSFSPLVNHDEEPDYACVPGTKIRPHWPVDLRPYAIMAQACDDSVQGPVRYG